MATCGRRAHNETVRAPESNHVLDFDQLRSVTLDDEELMREILAALLDDTGHQLTELEQAIRSGDAERTARLAHYSKGACANVGAQSSAVLLHSLERSAVAGDLVACTASLTALATEIERLRAEAETL